MTYVSNPYALKDLAYTGITLKYINDIGGDLFSSGGKLTQEVASQFQELDDSIDEAYFHFVSLENQIPTPPTNYTLSFTNFAPAPNAVDAATNPSRVDVSLVVEGVYSLVKQGGTNLVLTPPAGMGRLPQSILLPAPRSTDTLFFSQLGITLVWAAVQDFSLITSGTITARSTGAYKLNFSGFSSPPSPLDDNTKWSSVDKQKIKKGTYAVTHDSRIAGNFLLTPPYGSTESVAPNQAGELVFVSSGVTLRWGAAPNFASLISGVGFVEVVSV